MTPRIHVRILSIRIDERRAVEHRDLIFALGLEDTFITQTERGERALDEYELTQHYTHWRDDLALVAQTGATMLRWGVPWHRVNPERGRWDFSWLDAVAAWLAELGIEPIWDLVHYGTPRWMDAEFCHPDYPKFVAEYAYRIGERYGQAMPYFTPFNEPALAVLYCGRYGYWPPYRTGDRGFGELLRAVCRGIVLAQEAFIDGSAGSGVAVHAEAAMRFEGFDPLASQTARTLTDEALLPEDLITGLVNEEHPLVGFLQSNGFDDGDLEWFADRHAIPGMMGVNYYPAVSSQVVTTDGPDGSPSNPRPVRNAWTDGLEDVLRRFSVRYGRPVFLTETNYPGSIEGRLAWLDASVETVRRLRADGVDVVGYTWWSFLDMVEWDYRTSTVPVPGHLLRMGLWDLVPSADGSLLRQENRLRARYAEHAGLPI